MATVFAEAYARLNTAQKEAVDHIDGPLLVVAGPGTGKTQLLAMRVATILQKTDMNPSNILCLTFTESGQQAMQERLLKLIGHDAYRVAIHTFHSFGRHVMGTHSDEFLESFNERPADDLTRYELLSELLVRLPHDNPLGALYQGSYVYSKDIQARISQCKQAGMWPSDLRSRLQNDQHWLTAAQGLVQAKLAAIARITKTSLPTFNQLLEGLQALQHTSELGTLATEQLREALLLSSDGVTKPLTTWKNAWLTKNGERTWLFIASKQLAKLQLLTEVYESYLAALRTRKLYDYDDMIMRVIQKLRSNRDLKAELQEAYQYILVDEYQDTNGSQAQLLELLADNPVHEGKPNLMVVGDDDQAIYSFQGAYASNLLEFQQRWQAVTTITLDQNYRSTPPILALARSLITQGEDRLEHHYPELNKQLVANRGGTELPRWQQFDSAVEQYSWLADSIAAQVAHGTPAHEIAVLAPKHKHLETLVPYLLDRTIPVAYEKSQNVLEEQHVQELVQLATVITQLSTGQLDSANQLLPELLSYPWWGIAPGWLWELHLAGKKNNQAQWLELLRRSPKKPLRDIAQWLLVQAQQALITPLELQLDELIGPAAANKTFASPYRQYYFPPAALDSARINYVQLLSSLVCLRSHLREYLPDQPLKLADFVNFVKLRHDAQLKIVNDHPLVLHQDAVQLMTVHKAKGLEFDSVYIINTDEHTWVKDRGQSNKISLPLDLSIAPSGETPDERLRLFYVAATRARRQLYLSSYRRDDQGKASLPLGWLGEDTVKERVAVTSPEDQPPQRPAVLTRGLSFDWRSPHFDLRTNPQWRDLLSPELQAYQLSPTHLTAFLDVTNGGPKAFLVNQLLRFPAALSPSAQFGNALHALLKHLHNYVSESHKLPTQATAWRWLQEEITARHLGPIEEPKQLRRGELALKALYKDRKTAFHAQQLAEVDFRGEGVVIAGAQLRGIIDVLDLDVSKKTAFIIDYKTGKPARHWPASDAKITANTSYELHKLHRYRQQLLFYTLLVENSRTWGGTYNVAGAALDYLEPEAEEPLVRLELAYTTAEVDRLKKLLVAVWHKIIRLDLPDTSHYVADFSGVLQFEDDLLQGLI